MSIIGELVENIYKYGNCKFYTRYNNYKEILGYSFKVDEYGNLNVTQILDSYDRPLLNGNKKNENAILEKSVELLKYNEEDLSLVLSLVIYSSIVECPKIIIKDENVYKENTDKVIIKLYETIYAMFQLSLSDLLNWFLGNEIGIESQLERNGKKKVNLIETDTSQIIKNIEFMRKEILDKLKYIKSIWEKLQKASSCEEEVAKQWCDLYNNHEVLKFNLPKNN